MVLYGSKNTRQINLETMILHGRAVKKSVKKSFVVFDMPYKTYSNKFIAYKNAKKLRKLTKCDAVKLEGGKNLARIIRYLTAKGIPVMGHIGLLPQYVRNFKFKGKSTRQKNKILEDAITLADSGAFAIVIECVVEGLAKKITNTIDVPTIGIGASKYCDGQILVTDDIIGLSDITAKFVKKYANVKKTIEKSVRNYCKEVKLKTFPSYKNVYKY